MYELHQIFWGVPQGAFNPYIWTVPQTDLSSVPWCFVTYYQKAILGTIFLPFTVWVVIVLQQATSFVTADVFVTAEYISKYNVNTFCLPAFRSMRSDNEFPDKYLKLNLETVNHSPLPNKHGQDVAREALWVTVHTDMCTCMHYISTAAVFSRYIWKK